LKNRNISQQEKVKKLRQGLLWQADDLIRGISQLCNLKGEGIGDDPDIEAMVSLVNAVRTMLNEKEQASHDTQRSLEYALGLLGYRSELQPDRRKREKFSEPPTRDDMEYMNEETKKHAEEKYGTEAIDAQTRKKRELELDDDDRSWLQTHDMKMPDVEEK
jgi:hypothetical protein